MLYDLYHYPNNNRKAYLDFFTNPIFKNYLVAVKCLQQSKCYIPYSSELYEVNQLIEKNKIDKAYKFLLKNSANMILSPRFHWVMSFILNELKEDEDANLSFVISSNCIKGILSSGNGSKEKPYLITRISDEHDVLEHLEKILALQSLEKIERKSYDHLQCTDKSELWFDITNIIQ